jgi:predicted component of type VI protein secretion system
MSDFLFKLTAPIAGDDPFGADVNHDSDYERLKGEIGKLGDIDVDTVETLSLSILTEKSKDIRAMAWLAYATLRKGDLGRLADVVCTLVDYCADSFEQIFPRRESARLAALRWLSEPRFTSQCPKTEAEERDAPHIARLKNALTKLKPALEKRFPSTGAPFPSLLYKRVLEWDKAAQVQTIYQPAAPSDPPLMVAESPVSHVNFNLGGDDPGRRPATVVIKLTHSEYQEILGGIDRMKTLLKRFA